MLYECLPFTSGTAGRVTSLSLQHSLGISGSRRGGRPSVSGVTKVGANRRSTQHTRFWRSGHNQSLPALRALPNNTMSGQSRHPTAMASPDFLSESQTTFPSDSENYDANHSNQDSSDEPPSTSSSPGMILYSPPTIWSIMRGAAINVLLPFINGLMLGFGELFAHEAAFRLGWANTKVSSRSCTASRVAC